MKKLKPRTEFIEDKSHTSVFKRLCTNLDAGKKVCIGEIIELISTYDKRDFYPLVGESLEAIGFDKCIVHRDGDTNMRFDAAIVEPYRSIPIEIKSPAEIKYINTKSIRQALENKIILLSRGFYDSDKETTSLSIGYIYPNERSGVYELIRDIKKSFGFNIGIIDIETILEMRWKVEIQKTKIDLSSIYNLNGKLKL